jgi:hypothetical protein
VRPPVTRVSSCAFIFKGPGMNADRHHAVLRSDDFFMRVVGVQSIEEAITAAASLVAEGAELVELCGAFDETDAHRVSAAIGLTTPVGVVTFSGDQADRLEALTSRSGGPRRRS